MDINGISDRAIPYTPMPLFQLYDLMEPDLHNTDGDLRACV